MTELIEILVWRFVWWAIRIFWLPLLLVGLAYYVVMPALSGLAQLLFTPSGLLLAALVLLWMRRR